jgi:hypothetical protein
LEEAFQLQLTWATGEAAAAAVVVVLAPVEAALRQRALMMMMIVHAASCFVSWQPAPDEQKPSGAASSSAP